MNAMTNMTEVVPHPFLFRFSLPVRRWDGVPKRGKRLLDLSSEFALPDLCELRSVRPIGEVRVAWNDRGPPPPPELPP